MDAPERIYGWQHTQFSLAKYYGGIRYKGHHYAIDYGDKDAPLVRDDVLRRDAKAAKEWRDAERKKWKAAQDSLFD